MIHVRARRKMLCVAAGLLSLWASAAAGSGWDCTYEGNGADPAHYVVHFQKRGDTLVEPHWPASITYRILADTREMLIAVHAEAKRPSFRRDAKGAATIIMLDKMTGRLRRASGDSDGETDRIEFGTCERW